MDDDVLDFSASKGMPLRYRWKLLKLAGLHKNWLLNQQVSLWVSTSYLAKKYQAWSPIVIEPKPLEKLSRPVKVFYHGSASHQAEIDWLYPIIQSVLQKNPSIVFEIMGSQLVYQQFKGLDRVHIVHPMNWQSYQYFIDQSGRDIGLVPLVDNVFNKARSYTKFYDVTRAGAVGLYSEGSEVAHLLAGTHQARIDGLAGLVLPLDQAVWEIKILELANNAELRSNMLTEANKMITSIKDADFASWD
jgi:hypothetical protein